MTGRLGSIYGHKKVLLGGAAWWVVWSFINAFCNNFILFNVARALSGIGAAMIVPNAIAIIGTTLPPGKLRNLSLGFFGAGAPVGGWLGALFAGLLAELTPWKWLFIFMYVWPRREPWVELTRCDQGLAGIDGFWKSCAPASFRKPS